MEKLLTVAVPSFNSEDYLRRAVDSLLPGGNRLEILIVNDGSTDGTAEIAGACAEKNPDIVRVLHKENGGHGDAVMAGLREARGRYFMVLDSDDRADGGALVRLLDSLEAQNAAVDLFITNYTYEKAGKKHPYTVRFTDVLPEGRVFGWEETKKFRPGNMLMMHAVTYRTALLRECGLSLPKHTFYVDNLYVFRPMFYVEKMFYLNVDLYRYTVGRPGQSTQQEVIFTRLDQQLRVNREMLYAFQPEKAANPKKRDYLYRYYEMITASTVAYVIAGGKREEEEKLTELMEETGRAQPDLYRWLYGSFPHWRAANILNIPSRSIRNGLIRLLYRTARRIFGFS